MTLPVLKIAVVGHTNTGKTSLLRTLMRDVTFGEVSDRPATTRHVEGATLIINGEPAVELYDTPGLEDSIALLDHLDSYRGTGSRRPVGIELINTFLAGPEAHGRFSQEAKALRQVMACDASLYVIDARDRVLGKHKDELEILARCAKPVIPVLNFTADPEAQTAVWREHLAHVNMHAVAEFDTVVLDENSERRLLEKMRSLLDRHHTTLDALIDERERQRAALIRHSASLVADLLIDAAALVLIVPHELPALSAPAIESIKQRVRDREQQCVDQLLSLHRFRTEDYRKADLPLTDGQWGTDLFSPEALKQFGVRTGSAAAAGAMVGLTIDAMMGGLSGGAGAAIGAAIGAVAGLARAHGRRMIERMQGRSELRCDDATLKLLTSRQLLLIRALLRRGHASMEPISTESAHASKLESTALVPIASEPLPPPLQHARLKPEWSRLNDRVNQMAISGQTRLSAQDAVGNALAARLIKETAASPRKGIMRTRSGD